MSIRYYTEKGNGCGKSGNKSENEFTDSGKFRKLKVNKLRAKNLCAKNAKIDNLEVTNFKFAGQTGSANINVNNITTNSIDTKQFLLNGQDLTCYLTSQDIDSNLGLDPLGENGLPIHLANINDSLYNALQCNAESELEALRMRLEEGRQAIRKYESEMGCATCGPQGPVGMSIYGYITRPVLGIKQCGPLGPSSQSGVSGASGTNGKIYDIISSLSYNLEIQYDVNEVKSTQPRVVSVLCQIAYNSREIGAFGPTGPCKGPSGDCGRDVCDPVYLEEILIANKQYTPTLDYLYGEIFSGVINFDTNLIEEAAIEMPDINNSAAVQLVFFVEDGLVPYSQSSTRGNEKCTTNCYSTEQRKTLPAQTCPEGYIKCSDGDNFSCAFNPVVSFNAVPNNGPAPLTVQFNNTSQYVTVEVANIKGSIEGNVLTVTNSPELLRGYIIKSDSIAPDTYVIKRLSDNTYNVNIAQTVADGSIQVIKGFKFNISWDFGDYEYLSSEVSSEPYSLSILSPEHTYNNAGSYKVKLVMYQEKPINSDYECPRPIPVSTAIQIIIVN